MKKRLLSIALALSLIAPVCATPTAEAYNTGTVDQPSIVSMEGHCGLIADDGSLWVWGNNYDGQLGDGTETDRWKPVKVMSNVKSIALGQDNTAAIKTDGSLWVWGNGADYTTGDGTDNSYKTPVKIMKNVASVTFGMSGVAAIKTDGSLWVWGYEWSSGIHRKTPQKIMDNVKSVAIGSYASAAIKKDGSLWMWGSNADGVLGIGKSTSERLSTPVKIMDGVESVALSHSNAAAIKTDGSLWMWGESPLGVDTDYLINSAPVKVMDDVKSVALSSYSRAAIKKDGSLWMWGGNGYYQLGDGTMKDRDYPVKIMDDVAAVSLALDSSMAIKSDGSVWVWGYWDSLGLGENYSGYVPLVYEGKTYPDYKFVTKPVRLTGFTISAVTKPQCTITLNLIGGEGTTKITCDKNGTITPPNNPSRDGYYFAGWYKDKACTKPWNFDTDKVTGNCTLYAKWEPKSTTTVTAEPSTQKVEIDGKKIVLNSYVLRNDQGYPVNFVKLRDIAFLLDGTEANFNVDWRNNAIRLDARQPYTTPNGAEMTVPTVAAAPAKTSLTPVLTGGVTAPLEAFLLTDKNGGGHNYFKLRDIGKVAGFNVEWDGARGIIVVTTTEDYIG